MPAPTPRIAHRNAPAYGDRVNLIKDAIDQARRKAVVQSWLGHRDIKSTGTKPNFATLRLLITARASRSGSVGCVFACFGTPYRW
jgi:hypothetical protein